MSPQQQAALTLANAATVVAATMQRIVGGDISNQIGNTPLTFNLMAEMAVTEIADMQAKKGN